MCCHIHQQHVVHSTTVSLQVEIRVRREVGIRFISISMENQADVLKRATQVVNTVSQRKKVMIWMREHIEIGDSHNFPSRAVDEHPQIFTALSRDANRRKAAR